MDNDSESFLYNLLSIPSPTGFEVEGQKAWLKKCSEFSDLIDNDSHGNAWASIKSNDPNSPIVMIEAHSDEIGFMVKYISNEGFIRIDRIGGSDWATARGRRISIFGDKGKVLGIIGNTAIHIRDKKDLTKGPEVHELYVDIGASSKEEVEEMGIRIGHPAVYVEEAIKFANNRITGRALDNRIGGFIISEVLKNLFKGSDRPISTVIALNSIQEEIGGHGAKMASYSIKPDICIVIDVTHATDTPDINHAMHGEVKLGGGPTVTHGTSNHKLIVDRIIDIANQNKIPLQHESSSRYSGTDTDSIFYQRGGIPSALLSLPLRYMHSVVEMADMKDVKNIINLLTYFIKSIKNKEDFSFNLVNN